MEGKGYKLSRDYARAWELIQQGKKLACEYDRPDSRDVGRAEKSVSNSTVVLNGWCHYLPNGFNGFAKRCTELNIEFYLPVAEDMIVIPEQRFEEIISKIIDRNFENLKRHREGLHHA